MNWDAIGAIGQVLGSIAVFITLGYLALQVRYANHDLRRSISQGRGEAVRNLFMARATDGQLGLIFARANEAFGGQPDPFITAVMQEAGLTHEDAVRLASEQAAWLNYRAQVFRYIDELSAADRALFENGTRRTYGNGVGRVYFETTIRSIADPALVRYIDNLLA